MFRSNVLCEGEVIDMLFHVSAYSGTSGKHILNIKKKYLTVSKTNNSLIVSE